MSSRSLITVALLCALLGCSSDQAESAGAAADMHHDVPVLRSEGTGELLLVTGQAIDLRVQLVSAHGEPQAGQTVEFALLGDAQGASLSQALVPTDAAGYARVTLRAGSNAAQFELRASASGATSTKFIVRVEQGAVLTASVGVRYEGQRAIASRTVTLVADGSCAQLSKEQLKLSTRNAPSSVLFEPGQRASFPLVPERSYALVAWASDRSNSRLAYGCTELLAGGPTERTAPSEQQVEVTLADTQLTLSPSSYDLLLTLQLAQALQAVNESARATVTAALPGQVQPEAALYLEAVELSLPEAQRGSFRAQRVAVSGLDDQLAARLAARMAGPLRFAEQLALLISSRGEGATVTAALHVMEPSQLTRFDISRLYAVSSDAMAMMVEFDPERLSSQASISARYEESRAAIVISSLSLRFGLGTYAQQLLGSLGSADSLVARLGAAHGCGELRGLPGLAAYLSDAEAEARCRERVLLLLNSVRTDLAALDMELPEIRLSGSLPVHDRDDDGSVDDLGTSDLSGSWGSQLDQEQGRAVSASLRVPPSTALAL